METERAVKGTERTEKRRSKRRVSDRSVSRRPSLNLLPFISFGPGSAPRFACRTRGMGMGEE